jgi:hypothetical protein
MFKEIIDLPLDKIKDRKSNIQIHLDDIVTEIHAE